MATARNFQFILEKFNEDRMCTYTISSPYKYDDDGDDVTYIELKRV